ncbi:MAG: aminopeptidase [Euryarchaeota archaeon]|nr:aminopeptidase [Euryarchaeota archaeon]
MRRLAEIFKTTLAIRREEEVLLVTDDAMLEVASLVEAALRELSDEVLVLRMHPRSMHGEEPPRVVAEAMKHASVVVAPTSKSLSHTSARKRACEAGARVATMPGITLDMLTSGGMLADYREVERLARAVAERLTEAKTIRIKTELGTDFEASLKGRRALADTGIIAKPGDFGNLPAGEGFIAPVEGESEGVLVFDGSFGMLGKLAEPLKIRVAEGKAVEVSGDGGRVEAIFARYANAENVAEIGVGVNPSAKVIGNVLEDEKVFRTIHVAFGDNHTFGGRTRAEVHLDGVILNPDVWLDGEKFMERGRICSL